MSDLKVFVEKHRVRIALCAASIAAVLAAVSVVTLVRVSDDPARKFAESRDSVLSAAQTRIAQFQTLDYRNVDDGYRKWEELSTGQLHDELTTSQPAAKKGIADAKMITTGKVVEAAVTELDDRAGSATVIAAVDITVTPQKGEARLKRNRFSAQLSRTGEEWKLSQLSTIPLSAS